MFMNCCKNDILVKLSREENILTVVTKDRTHGRSRRFLTLADKLQAWLDSRGERPLFDTDLQNILRVERCALDQLRVTIWWLREDSFDCRLEGFRQILRVPVSVVQNALNGQKTCAIWQEPEYTPQSRIIVTPGAQHRIAMLPKLQRRAMMKALRDSFRYGDDIVTIGQDFGSDYLIRLRCGIVEYMYGGLCLSETTAKGRDGQKHRRVYYSVHT